MKKVVILLTAVLFVGCVGSPIHETLSYGKVKAKIKRNNASLLNLRIGINQAEANKLMGDPKRSEGYPWGTVWLYRTAMTQGIHGSIYGEIDPDYTPLLFGEDGKLIGWGRNYYEQYVQKYELKIEQSPHPRP